MDVLARLIHHAEVQRNLEAEAKREADSKERQRKAMAEALLR